MIRSRLIPPFRGLFGNGRYLDLAGCHRLYCRDWRMGDEQVVDEFPFASEDAGEALFFRDERCEVP